MNNKNKGLSEELRIISSGSHTLSAFFWTTLGVVLRQGYIDGFSTTVVFRNKAQHAANGTVLVKCCNAVAEHHSGARRVGLSAFMAALRPCEGLWPFTARRVLP